MAISRDKKEQLVQEYVTELKRSEGVIVTGYKGLKVSELEQLRTKIRETDGAFYVVKNTLAQHAIQQANLPAIDEILSGPVGISFCHSNVAGVAKIIIDFSKQKESLKIKGGLLGNKSLDETEVRSLANLPSISILRGQLLGLINAPASRLVGVLASGVRQLASVINAYVDKNKESAESVAEITEPVVEESAESVTEITEPVVEESAAVVS